MKQLPYVIISTAMSLDGYIDDTSDNRLRISNEKDFERVGKLRESCDGILVGANTIRKDNPRLVLKSGKKFTKITVISSNNLEPTANFFTLGDSEKIVYATSNQIDTLNDKLSSIATIVDGGSQKIDLQTILEDLYNRGIKRLLVEGGSSILTQFLQEGLVNELQLSIGGFFVGEKDASRFVKDGKFPWNEKKPMHLDTIEKLDDIAVLIYKV